MKLTDLQATFLTNSSHSGHTMTDRRDGADGVFFLCPKCFAANDGSVGTHGIICWFVGRVPDYLVPGPARWTPSGTSLTDLSLTPSILLPGEGCGWHGFVTNGDAT